METVHVRKSDFNKILNAAEVLIDEVEHVLSHDEVVKKRMDDITKKKVKGKTEKELDNYLKSRGVNC